MGLECSDCHKAPTDNWLTAYVSTGVADYPIPDVADYPTHDACARCHRLQFFKGALPVICSICHTKVSPRSRVRFTFGKPNQPSQFKTIFPHGKHQDIIALNRFTNTFESAHAMQGASFKPDDKKVAYNDCTSCHQRENGILNTQSGFPDVFQMWRGTFMTMPVGHASCFSCHWQNQKPTRESCKGCHGLSPTDMPILTAPKRISLKFKHQDSNHGGECTVCHVNITREARLIVSKPDVPITACADPACHGRNNRLKDKVTIYTESKARADSIKSNEIPVFECTKCHASEIGKKVEPPSHRAALKK